MLQRDNTYKLMSCSGTGDFNKLNRHPIIKNLSKYTPLKDAYQAAPVKYNESKNNLDWMFVSRNTVDVLTYQSGLVKGIEKPSDHESRVVELLIY